MGKRIAVFASGSGTNAENLIDYFKKSSEGKVVLVVTNKSDAGVINRADRLEVPCLYFANNEWAEGAAIIEAMRHYDIDFIVLAGFLKRIPDVLLHAYPHHIVNIHPSLLPKYGGKGMYGDRVHHAVLLAGEEETGITIHYINEHYDEGDVIAQMTCPVMPEDNCESLASRVHKLEYKYYPHIVEQLLCKI